MCFQMARQASAGVAKLAAFILPFDEIRLSGYGRSNTLSLICRFSNTAWA
jgi:hypothetical protein